METWSFVCATKKYLSGMKFLYNSDIIQTNKSDRNQTFLSPIRGAVSVCVPSSNLMQILSAESSFWNKWLPWYLAPKLWIAQMSFGGDLLLELMNYESAPTFSSNQKNDTANFVATIRKMSFCPGWAFRIEYMMIIKLDPNETEPNGHTHYSYTTQCSRRFTILAECGLEVHPSTVFIGWPRVSCLMADIYGIRN